MDLSKVRALPLSHTSRGVRETLGSLRALFLGNSLRIAGPAQAELHFMKKIPSGAEASNVLVGELDFLHQPLVAFVRLTPAVLLSGMTEVPIPTRSEGQARSLYLKKPQTHLKLPHDSGPKGTSGSCTFLPCCSSPSSLPCRIFETYRPILVKLAPK